MTERPANGGMTGSDRLLSARLASSRLATRLSMIVERGWSLVLPVLIVAGLFLSAAWLGLFSHLPDMLRVASVSVFALLAVAALYPLRFFHLPSTVEIDRRLETANQLLHSPVLVQTDRPSGRESGFAGALWREHQKRMAEKLGGLGADLPRTGIPARDPWGMRAVVALLLVTAFAFSFGPRGGTIADAFTPAAMRDAIPPRIDAWVTPPPYTGKPPIFLTAQANQASANQPVSAFTVPEGSEVSLRVTGGSGQEMLSISDSNGNVRTIEPSGQKTDPAKPGAPAQTAAGDGSPPAGITAVRQFASKLTADGTMMLKSGEDQLGSWAFAVVPDKAPSIRFAGEPKRAVNGTLELNYQIEDDYGAATAKADFALAEKQAANARPLYGPPDMALALPRRGAKNNAAKTTKDLTEHVWAGAKISVALAATDAAGQSARSETKTLIMPQRPFGNPLARALIEQRRLLALDANARPRVLDLMDAITLRPEDTLSDMSAYLAIMSARSRLKLADSDDQLRSVVSYLWEIAIGIEDGTLSAAEKRLRQAQQALKELLKNGASDEEIDKAMKELRAAMDDFLREFAERAKKDPNLAEIQKDAKQLSQNDLQKMMDQIEDLAKSGDRDKAQELLSQLENMMNNLQAGRQDQGQQSSEMRQQMDKLGDIMRRQQEMMNETFRMEQMQRDQMQRGENRDEQLGENGEQGQQGENGKPQQGDGRDQNGKPKPMTPQEFADAMKQLQEGQGKLQSELEQLKKGLEGMGLEPNEGFGQAGRSMGDAENSLGQGEGDRAVGHQGRALEALRQGAKDMMQQMQAMQGDQGGSEEGGRQQNADRDPLGRPMRSEGPDFGDTVKVPDEIDVQRARQILDAIRKRLGNALSPDIERSYLERLLELK